jgi:hypothetical protein
LAATSAPAQGSRRQVRSEAMNEKKSILRLGCEILVLVANLLKIVYYVLKILATEAVNYRVAYLRTQILSA